MSRGVDFEEKLARMYRHLGYRVERTQAYYGTRAAWVVTDSTFTAGAIAQAEPCGVRLIDGAELRVLRRKAWRRRWLPVLGVFACAALLAVCVLNPQGAAQLASWAQAR